MTIGLRVFLPIALGAAALVLNGCGVSSAPAVSIPATTAGQATAPASADDAGLIKAAHAQCDVGQKILRYISTGDNQGDPQLDVEFSRNVGSPLPQARSIADQYIQQCDASLSKQEAAQASAAAEAQAKASASAAAAQAAADRTAAEAAVQTNQQIACAAIGGRLDTGACYSIVQGSPGGPGLDCRYALITFKQDGTIDPAALADLKAQLPGCFH